MTETGHFNYRRGQDLVIEVTIDGDDDLSGYTWEATFRGYDTGLIAHTIEDASITLEGRVVSIPVTSAQTLTWTESKVRGTLWRVDNGSKNPYWEGFGTRTVNARNG